MTMAQAREAFLHPDHAYTPIPFWFWNDELTRDEIARQIDDFAQKGVMGFVIHPRKGLPRSIPYLSDAFMGFVRFAVEEAARRGMRVVLYDEAMYPSGSAHGMIVKENPDFASRCLCMEKTTADVPASPDLVAVCAARVDGDTVSDITVLAPEEGVYRAQDRTLLCFRLKFSGGTIRGVHEDEDDGEPLAPASADLLNPAAVASFIRLTHEVYYAHLQEYFGNTVIAMFTDEPDIVGRNALPGGKAWTEGFLPEFEAQGCTAADLPALWLNAGPATDDIRRKYRRAVNQRMIRTYYGPLADWCAQHHIALAGHPAKGYDMGLLSPFQLPGQDVVWRFVGPENGLRGEESVLAKCGSDAARHAGRPRNANECFGCCGPNGVQWAFTADEMKWYMDWLFVRGTNLLYPHAFFYSIRDGRGDERPPDVGPNNVWWPWYGQISAYIRRLCWLMTGVNQARIAVLCEEDRLPWEPCVALYEGQREFNYLSLEHLAQCRVQDGQLLIQQQRYDVVITGDVPLEDDAAAVLDTFLAQGGLVLAEPDPTQLPIDLRTDVPAPTLRMSHVVHGDTHFYLLVNEGETAIDCRLNTAVSGAAQWWNAWTGEISPATVDDAGWYTLQLERRESIILAIDPAGQSVVAQPVCAPAKTAQPLANCTWRVTPMNGGEAFTLVSDDEGRLPSWTEQPGLANYSGWMAYEAELTLDTPAELELGEASGLCRMLVNGEEIARSMWAPHRCQLPAGTIALRLEVSNTPANAFEGKVLPSGLMGPVVIRK